MLMERYYYINELEMELAQCSFAPPKSTLLFEQPELHLNHTAAKLLSGVLVAAAKEKSLHIVAETHSRELFHGLLDEVRAGRFNVKDLAIYTVVRENGCSQFKRIGVDVDADGHVDVSDPWDTKL